MLKCVKSLIEAAESDKTSFCQLYMEYIQKVQDENIDREVHKLLHSSQTKVGSVNLAIDDMLKSINK